jgi:hypothetical protein
MRQYQLGRSGLSARVREAFDYYFIEFAHSKIAINCKRYTTETCPASAGSANQFRQVFQRPTKPRLAVSLHDCGKILQALLMAFSMRVRQRASSEPAGKAIDEKNIFGPDLKRSERKLR